MRQKTVLMLALPIIVLLVLLGFFSVLAFLFPILSESYLGFLTISVTSTVLTLVITLVSQASSESLVETREKASEKRSLLQREKSEFFSPLVFMLRRANHAATISKVIVETYAEQLKVTDLERAPLSQEQLEPLFRDFLADKLALAADSEFRRDLVTLSWYVTVLDMFWSIVEGKAKKHDVSDRARRDLDNVRRMLDILNDALNHFSGFALGYLDFGGDPPAPIYKSFFTDDVVKEIRELAGVES